MSDPQHAVLECVELQSAPGEPAGTVIWLHGLGADARDFEPIVPMLRLAAPLRFVFPNAPERAVTINGGMVMRAWYDIDPGAPLAGTADIRESAGQIADLIAREVANGVPTDRITLAGFSQGGVIALHQGLRHEQPLAGIMALSTYVHDHEHLVDEISLANASVPIFMAHGMSDQMIPINRAVMSRQALEDLNYTVQWQQYGMGHEVCPEEISDIAQWLNQIYAT